MSNTRAQELGKILLDDEPITIYNILAREELDIASRNKFLKKYRLTDEGVKILKATLNYAVDAEHMAISRVKQDPYDRSGYNDYEAKTKIPKRVIADLQDNIRMGRLVQMHPTMWQKRVKDGVQHVAIDRVPMLDVRKY